MLRRLFLFLVVFLLMAPTARASEAFGPWSAVPGEEGTKAYDPELEPFSSAEQAERLSWACVDESGAAISPTEREQLAQIFRAAADVYDGKFSFGAGAALVSGPANSGTPENGGYRPGKAGMQAFLAQERSLLSNGLWTPYAGRSLQRTGVERGERVRVYPSAQGGWQVSLGEGRGIIGKSQGTKLAGLIPEEPTTPLDLNSDLPEACGLQGASPQGPTLQSQLLNPGDFLLDQVLYVPGKLANAGFEFVQPHAFSYTFWTAHTERGDLITQIPETCKAAGQDSRYLSQAEISEGCDGNRALGWSATAFDNPGEGSWFISAAQVVQWLVSGMYMLILFGAAIAYMLRGHRNSSTRIIQIVPKILLAALLTLFAGVIIGAGITVSNLIVQAIFEFSSSRPVGSLNAIVLQAGHVAGGPDLIQRIVELLVSSAAVFFYFVFVLASLARQIVLVLLVIFAPLAAMTLIVPRWRPHFRTYVRALAVCLVVPIALAAILKVGMSINPLVINPEGAYGSAEGFLGLMLLIATLWMMYKAIRWAVDYARHGDAALQPLRQAGARLLDPRGRSGSEGQSSPDLVPGERASIAGAVRTAGDRVTTAITTVGSQLGSHGALGTPQSAVPTLGSGQEEDPVQRFQSRRRSKGGPRRVSSGVARSWKQGLLSHLKSQEQSAGRKLTRAEIDQARREYERNSGMRMKQNNGIWSMERVSPETGETGEKT